MGRYDDTSRVHFYDALFDTPILDFKHQATNYGVIVMNLS